MLPSVRAILLCSVLLFSVLPFSPGAVGQDVPAAAETPDDPGDVKMEVPSAPPQTPPGTEGDRVDITKLVIGHETEKEVRFTLHFTAVEPDDFAVQPRVYFDFGGQSYMLGRGGQRCRDAGGYQIYMQDRSENRWNGYRCIEAALDESARTLALTVQKEHITTVNRSPIRFGDTINNVTATAEKRVTFGGWGGGGGGFLPTVKYTDRVPNSDEEFGTPYTLQLGRQGSGPVGLFCLDPVRVTNGEATTMVYSVELANKGTEEESFEITADLGEHQDHWTVRMPPILTVAPGETVKFPVIVSLPFTHEHGVTALFQMHAHSTRDPENVWSVVELGVHWTETPQPAGHHPELWFHSRIRDSSWGGDPAGIGNTVNEASEERVVWMNPNPTDTDEEADDGPVTPQDNAWVEGRMPWNGLDTSPPPEEWSAVWILPMAPGLLMGLDFDLERQGKFQGDIIFEDYAMDQTKLEVLLLHCDPTKGGLNANCNSNRTRNLNGDLWSVIARGESEEKAAPQGPDGVRYTVPLTIEKSADLLPYKKGANIALLLNLKSNLPANAMGNEPAVKLKVDYGTCETCLRPLQLPLNEYHDPIDDAFSKGLGGLLINPLVAVEKKVNPGRGTLFRFEVQNTLETEDNVEMLLQGSDNKEWAEFVGDKVFSLAPRTSREVQVLVRAPADASEEARVPLALIAQSLKQSTTMDIKRFTAVVVEGEDIPDEAPSLKVQGARGASPAFEVGLLLAASIGLALVMRRRPFA